MLTPEERRQTNKRNKSRGSAAERKIANITGGDRVPLSGAIKRGPYDLTGDVSIKRNNSTRELIKLEVKTSASVTPKGDRVYSLKKSVLDQAAREAAEVGSIGALWIHWNNLGHEQDYIVMEERHFEELIHLAKIGAEMVDNGYVT